MYAVNLHTEYLVNPIGLGICCPRLQWNCEAEDENVSRFQTAYEIIARDEQDMNREVSPLKQAEDAVLVDTSDMTIEEVVAKIRSLADGD